MAITKAYYLDKAAQCSRLASGRADQNDPAVAALHALASRFEACALALDDEEADAGFTRVDH